MKIVPGQRYVDGYGTEHYIVGLVPGKTNIFWANTGFWFLEDGRLHFRVSAELTKHDLVDPMYAPAEHLEIVLPSYEQQNSEQHPPDPM